MSFPFRYQVFLSMAGLMLITLIATSIVTATIQGRRITSQIEADLIRMEQTLQASSFPLTAPILEQLHGLTGAEFVLTDRNGRTLATTGPDIDSDRPNELVRHRNPALAPTVTIEDQRYFYRVVVPVRALATAPTQQLHILYPESIWTKARLEAIYPPLLTGAVGVAVTGVLSLLLARRVTRPIASLSRQMERLARNDYRSLALPKRRDEIRALIQEGNTLATRLRDLNSAIRRSERFAVLGRLGGGLAHQLRNGVTGARLAVQLHARGCDRDRESIDVALRQLEMMEKQLLTFLTIGRAGPVVNRPCNLAQLIDEVAQLVTSTCRHRSIALSKQIHWSETIAADGDQICQLLVNLTLNAIDATDRGGSVIMHLDKRDDTICLSVIDTGRGVAPPIADSLFDPFVTTKPEGIGLGLAVAKQVADSLAGEIRYRRDADRTHFELLFPIAGSAADSQSAFHGKTPSFTR